MYLKATLVTIVGWFIGMVLDANIDFGDPMGFLSLRILFPYLGHGTVHPARAETRQQPLTRKICGSHA